MPVLSAKILTAGKTAISNALLGVSPAKPHSFKCGDEFGFTPVTTDISPRGLLTFTGQATAIAATRLSADTVRYVCSISEQWGPFQVGNLILYMLDDAGAIQPFISVVLPVPVQKVQSAPITTVSGYQVPGSRLAFNIELKHSEEVEILSINIITPNYSSLPTFETEATIPPGAALTFKNFVVSHHTVIKKPVLGTVDGNAIRWGIPFYNQINDPGFGQLDGGDDTLPHHYYDGVEIISGNLYITPESSYTYPSYGGGLYTDTLYFTLGGARYDMTGLIAINFVP
jgi:hypothetical protein